MTAAIELLFDKNQLDVNKVTNIVTETLNDIEDGELFLEYSQSEAFSLDDGIIKNSNYSISSGFGFRGIIDDVFSYSHSSNINYQELAKAGEIVKSIRTYVKPSNHNLSKNIPLDRVSLYHSDNPLNELEFSFKINILKEIDKYLRNKNNLVEQVSATIAANWQVVAIINKDGKLSHDVRPLVRLTISVIVEKNYRMEVGSQSSGGRSPYMNHLNDWQKCADKALAIALVNLDAIAAPAGEMQVVLGAGWPGILLHEAIGHGLEGDFNRKKTSAFSNLLGTQVAASGVTVVDNGTIENRRGSLNIDDEGNPTTETVLIENGILKSYIQDKINAKLMQRAITGNGRRENFAHAPMPRMTNTHMLNGEKLPEEIISSVRNGLYAVSFGGGQVDITSGKFVFSASEAYLIENGKITTPVKGATLIGNGPDILTKVSMIGNDMQLDPGMGTCSKAGQGVPVGVGQPTLLIDSITVGGTSKK